MKSKLIQRGQRVTDINLKHCDSCFYFKIKSDNERDNARTPEEADSWHGRCRFLPSIVKKKQEDWCGQYKYFNITKIVGLINMSIKELLYDTETLDDYIDIYEHKYDNEIDMSPHYIQSDTEKRMIKELKKLNLIIKGNQYE